MNVKLAARKQTLARHALFCGPHLSNFIAILDVRELCLIILLFSRPHPVCSKKILSVPTKFLKNICPLVRNFSFQRTLLHRKKTQEIRNRFKVRIEELFLDNTILIV